MCRNSFVNQRFIHLQVLLFSFWHCFLRSAVLGILESLSACCCTNEPEGGFTKCLPTFWSLVVNSLRYIAKMHSSLSHCVCPQARFGFPKRAKSSINRFIFHSNDSRHGWRSHAFKCCKFRHLLLFQASPRQNQYKAQDPQYVSPPSVRQCKFWLNPRPHGKPIHHISQTTETKRWSSLILPLSLRWFCRIQSWAVSCMYPFCFCQNESSGKSSYSKLGEMDRLEAVHSEHASYSHHYFIPFLLCDATFPQFQQYVFVYFCRCFLAVVHPRHRAPAKTGPYSKRCSFIRRCLHFVVYVVVNDLKYHRVSF